MVGSLSNSEMEGESGEGGLRDWILMQMNRWLFTGTVLFLVYVVLVGFSQVGLSPLRHIIEGHNGTFWMFSTFVAAIITGTSIVVTINQLVLSQELGAVGDQRERMQESMEFRQNIENEIQEGASPPEPASFLYELINGIEDRADHLKESLDDNSDDDLEERINEYVNDLTDNAQSVKDNLEDAQFGTFEVIWNALNFNYSRKIYDARQIRAECSGSLSNETNDAIDGMIETLKMFGPAREHFKTLYFQWELINLSRALLYISIPTLTAMGVLLMYVDENTLPGTIFAVDNLVWITSAGFVFGIAPFVVFIAYVLRIATVAKRTLAMGPYILRESQRDEDTG